MADAIATVSDHRGARGSYDERRLTTRWPSAKPGPEVATAAPPPIKIKGRVLARIENYDALWNAVRSRYDALGITRMGADTLYLPDGYTGKLLGAAQVRKIGLHSLERVLEGTGCFLVLVEDPEASAKMMATAKELGLLTPMPASRAQTIAAPAGHRNRQAMSRREPESCCAICWVESNLCRRADVKWPGAPICRQHLAESHMRDEGISPYPVDVTIDAPAM